MPAMIPEPLPEIDEFAARLVALDEQLRRGDPAAMLHPLHKAKRSKENETSGANDITAENSNARLQKGLSTLKKLDSLRKKSKANTTASALTQIKNTTTSSFTHVQYKLPSRFGKFELIKELGRGGFGVVFLARDSVLDCEVALKIPHAHVLTNDDLRERFTREARVAAGLQHSHIVSVREAGAIGPVNYIVYDYCPGITLCEWLRKQKEQVSAQLAAVWTVRLAEAVAYAHSRGVMHRDLKPSNILLVEAEQGSPDVSGTSYTPKITDFGLAKLEKEKDKTNTGALIGTPSYMAPEQASGTKSITPSIDIHGLGVLLYEMLSGHPPFRGETDLETLHMVSHEEPLSLRKIRPKLSGDLETICMKCLQKDPKLRYKSAYDLVVDLYHFLNNEPIKARPVSTMERLWRKCQKHPLVSGLLLTLLVVTIVAVAAILWQNHEKGVQADATRNWLNKYLGFLRSEVATAEEMIKDVRTEKQGRDKLIALLPYYDTLLNDPQSDAGLQLEAARLCEQAGKIHAILQEHNKAIDRFQQAVKIIDQVIKGKGQSKELVLEQVKSLSRMAYSYRSMEQWQKSYQVYQQAIERAKYILSIDPQHAEAAYHVSRALVFGSFCLPPMNRFKEEESELLEAREYITKALQSKPDDLEYQAQLALTIGDYGWHCFMANRTEEAEKYFLEAKTIRENIIARDDSNAGLIDAHAENYARFGRLGMRRKDLKMAIDNYTMAKNITDECMLKFPGIIRFIGRSAGWRHRLVQLYETQKDPVQSEKYMREIIEIRKKGELNFPGFMENRWEVARDYLKLAGLLRKHARKTEAYTAYHQGLELKEKLLKEFPDQKVRLEQYLDNLKGLALWYKEDHKPAELEEVNRKIDDVRQRLNAMK